MLSLKKIHNTRRRECETAAYFDVPALRGMCRRMVPVVKAVIMVRYLAASSLAATVYVGRASGRVGEMGERGTDFNWNVVPAISLDLNPKTQIKGARRPDYFAIVAQDFGYRIH